MNIENIHNGFVAKNYKHMCKVLGEEIKTAGGAKKSQLKKWASYFEFKKDGNKLVVTDIFHEQKELSRGGNFTPYIEEMNELLIQILLKAENYKIMLSKNRLLLMLNMINENYRGCRDRITGLSEYLNIDKIDVYDFYNITDNVLKRNVETSLRSLKNKKAIFYKTALILCDYRGVHRKASDEEEEIILTIQADVLKSMNYSGLLEVYRNGKIEEYTKLCNKEFLEQANISYVYEAYDITLNRDRLKKEVTLMSAEKIREINNTLNLSVQIRLMENANKRHDKAKVKEDEWFGEVDDRHEFRGRKGYLDNQRKLIDILIDKKHKIITDDVKSIDKAKKNT